MIEKLIMVDGTESNKKRKEPVELELLSIRHRTTCPAAAHHWVGQAGDENN